VQACEKAPDVAAILPNAVWGEWLIAVGYQLTHRLRPSGRRTNSPAQCLNVQYVKLGGGISHAGQCIEFYMTRELLNPQTNPLANLPWLEFSVAALGIGAIDSGETWVRFISIGVLHKYTIPRVFNKKLSYLWETVHAPSYLEISISIWSTTTSYLVVTSRYWR